MRRIRSERAAVGCKLSRICDISYHSGAGRRKCLSAQRPLSAQ